MIEILISLILISAVAMSGFRRARLLNRGFALQSLTIALLCLSKGYITGEYHYYILFILTLITKVIIIPMIIRRSLIHTADEGDRPYTERILVIHSHGDSGGDELHLPW